MEMVGVDQLVMDELEKYMSARLCPNTTGQVRYSQGRSQAFNWVGSLDEKWTFS